MSKDRKQQLGLTISAATGKLRKELLFSFVKKLQLNTCYRCGEDITNVDDFTMDHKVAWRGKENAKELFFDLNNVGFSHHNCNAGATERIEKHPSWYSYKKGCRCKECKDINTERVNHYRDKRNEKELV